MLAPIIGSETHAASGGNHFTSFCRAANAGCVTPFEDLWNPKDKNKKIDVTPLKAKKVFKKLLEDGWQWFVISSDVEEAVSELADFLQLEVM